MINKAIREPVNLEGCEIEYLTPKEAAEILRVGYINVIRRLNEGNLPGIRMGRVWRIPKHAILADNEPNKFNG